MKQTRLPGRLTNPLLAAPKNGTLLVLAKSAILRHTCQPLLVWFSRLSFVKEVWPMQRKSRLNCMAVKEFRRVTWLPPWRRAPVSLRSKGTDRPAKKEASRTQQKKRCGMPVNRSARRNLASSRQRQLVEASYCHRVEKAAIQTRASGWSTKIRSTWLRTLCHSAEDKVKPICFRSSGCSNRR